MLTSLLPQSLEEEEPHVLNLDDLKELQFMLAQADLEEEARRRSPNRVKVLCLSIWYPLSMSRYFERAMRRNPDIDLVTVGSYTGAWIPWTDAQNPSGMTLPIKYATEPTITLPFPPNVSTVNYEFIKSKIEKEIGNWKPDLVVAIDAGVNWASKPQDGYVVTVGTDPHVLDYSHARRVSDKFFNMQKCYSQDKDIYLPYAYDPTVHYPQERYVPAVFKGVTREDGSGVDRYTGDPYKDLDAVLIGNIYQERVQWVSELRKHGVSVEHKLGVVFDEARELANRARIGLNWSTLNDLNARFFETPAYGLAMVSNRVPDAHLFLTEGEDYVGFTGMDEGIEKVLYLKNNPEELERIARNGYKKIRNETYDVRVEKILRECGF